MHVLVGDVNMFDPNKRPIWVSEKGVRPHEVLSLSKVKNPKVSVIVPIYNMKSKGFLGDLLRSLEQQTLASIELILVDDCSTDDTLNSLVCFGRERNNVTVIHSSTNGRQGAARNIGIEYACGVYIGFVDGDDAVDSNYFEKLYYIANKYKADIATAPYVFTDNRLNPISETTPSIKSNLCGLISEKEREELISSPVHIWSSIYKSTLFSECGLRFPEGVFFEDNPTCFRLVCQARTWVVLDEGDSTPRYYYRQNESSTDHRCDIVPQLISDRIATSNMLFDDAVSSGIYEDFKNSVTVYYLQIALLNTLKKVSICYLFENELVEEILKSVRNRIESKYSLISLDCSLTKKVQILLAFNFPKAYLALLRIGKNKS